MLAHDEVLAPVYYILGGTKSGEVTIAFDLILNASSTDSCFETQWLSEAICWACRCILKATLWFLLNVNEYGHIFV